MRGMDSNSVDLIYLDPPFNSNRNYEAPVGSKAAGAAFRDAWTLDDIDEAWVEDIEVSDSGLYHFITSAGSIHSDGMKGYLVYMTIRLMEMHRILKDTGSIYLHVDPTASHYLKGIMDAIFGQKNFVNEIIWFYKAMSAAKNHFPRKHDVLLYYCLDNKKGYTFNGDSVREQYDEKTLKRYENPVEFPGGYKAKKNDLGRLPYDVWQIPPIRNVSKEKTGYPTQKPLALLERIIKASSNEGDIVFDPFCGCATTLVAAEKLGRQWIGCDISEKAYELVRDRLVDTLPDDEKIYLEHKTPTRSIIDIGVRSKNIRQVLFAKQKGVCVGCEETLSIKHFEIDHIIATSKGGQNVDDNLQLLCGWCNRTKGNRPMEYLKLQLKG